MQQDRSHITQKNASREKAWTTSLIPSCISPFFSSSTYCVMSWPLSFSKSHCIFFFLFPLCFSSYSIPLAHLPFSSRPSPLGFYASSVRTPPHFSEPCMYGGFGTTLPLVSQSHFTRTFRGPLCTSEGHTDGVVLLNSVSDRATIPVLFPSSRPPLTIPLPVSPTGLITLMRWPLLCPFYCTILYIQCVHTVHTELTLPYCTYLTLPYPTLNPILSYPILSLCFQLTIIVLYLLSPLGPTRL